MNREELCQFLLWSLAINFGILLIWFIAFVAGRDWMYSLHAR